MVDLLGKAGIRGPRLGSEDASRLEQPHRLGAM
jgi:hypothetical protein